MSHKNSLGALERKHLENILYRENDLNERIKLVYKWVREKEDLSEDDFIKLVLQCNDKQIQFDDKRKGGLL